MKRYKIKNTLIGLVLITLLAACEEVIEIDLNTSDPVISAEGLIEKDSVAWLKLSYTTDYFKSEESEKIENAIVTISDSEGFSESLEHLGDGIYMGSTILGKPDMEYKLSFSTEDYSKNASSELLSPVEIYAVEFEENDMPRPGEENTYKVNLKFSNNSEATDYSFAKFWANNVEQKEMYYLVNDEYFAKGDTTEYTPFQLTFNKGDDVKVVIYSIDENTYKYYSQLNDLNGGRMGASSTPYNPQSNFGDDVMGYFVAWSFAEYNIEVN